MSEDEILCARRRADGIGLHEPEAVDGVGERRRRKERLRDGLCAAAGVRQSRIGHRYSVVTFSPRSYFAPILRIEDAHNAIDLVLRRPVELADVAVIPEAAAERAALPTTPRGCMACGRARRATPGCGRATQDRAPPTSALLCAHESARPRCPRPTTQPHSPADDRGRRCLRFDTAARETSDRTRAARQPSRTQKMARPTVITAITAINGPATAFAKATADPGDCMHGHGARQHEHQRDRRQKKPQVRPIVKGRVDEIDEAGREDQTDRERDIGTLLARDDKRRSKGEQRKRRVRFDEPPEIARRVERDHRHTKELSELPVTGSIGTAVKLRRSATDTSNANGAAATANRATFLIPDPNPRSRLRARPRARAEASSDERAARARNRRRRAPTAGEAAPRTSPSTTRRSSHRSSAGQPDRASPDSKQ